LKVKVPLKTQNIYLKVTGIQYSFFSLLLSEPGSVIMLTEGVTIISELPEKIGASNKFLIALPEITFAELSPLRYSLT